MEKSIIYASDGQLGAPAMNETCGHEVTLTYAWVVLTLLFLLMLCDYMSRLVLNAIFPMLKADWALTDGQLGSLSGIIAIVVGTLTFPLAVLADRWGKVRSIVLMAVVWSLATFGCALARNYNEMFLARIVIGVGEAAYGGVGAAILVTIFPRHLRASVSGIFAAGGPFGSFLGIMSGGMLSSHLGWRGAFASMAVFGLILALVFRVVVSERKLGFPGHRTESRKMGRTPLKTLFRRLFSTRSLICAYAGNGIQLMVPAALIAWLPSFLNRYYHLESGKAAVFASGLILVLAAGMVTCGVISDYVARHVAIRTWTMSIIFALGTCATLFAAFHMPVGIAQLTLIAVGAFLSQGPDGPSNVLVADLTQPDIRASAITVKVLLKNLLGLAPGPILVGLLADRFSLMSALGAISLVGLLSATVLAIGQRSYLQDREYVEAARM